MEGILGTKSSTEDSLNDFDNKVIFKNLFKKSLTLYC